MQCNVIIIHVTFLCATENPAVSFASHTKCLANYMLHGYWNVETIYNIQ